MLPSSYENDQCKRTPLLCVCVCVHNNISYARFQRKQTAER